jgi:flavorubredoxin
VLDPGELEYVILLHFEADENGGMDRFLEGAPDPFAYQGKLLGREVLPS